MKRRLGSERPFGGAGRTSYSEEMHSCQITTLPSAGRNAKAWNDFWPQASLHRPKCLVGPFDKFFFSAQSCLKPNYFTLVCFFRCQKLDDHVFCLVPVGFYYGYKALCPRLSVTRVHILTHTGAGLGSNHSLGFYL